MNKEIINISNLSKCYKRKYALEEINLDIAQGEMIGILGKNGSGKTTLNKIIAGFVYPSSGGIEVNGKKPQGGEKFVSFLSENIAIYPDLSASENLKQIYLMNNQKPNSEKIKKILETISLDSSNKKSKDFSLGMKRRLQIAMSVLITPHDIIILDEPTNGLDINGVLWLKEVIKEFKRQKKTIILTSHAILELEELLERYLILGEGKIIDSGYMADLKTVLNIAVDNQDIFRAKELFDKSSIEYQLNDNAFYIAVGEGSKISKVINVLNGGNIDIKSIQTSKESLISKFVNALEGKNE